MKNTYILLLVSAAFFAADSLYPADKYFGDTSAVFTSNTAWFSDEARTERTTPPTSGEDTAIFYKTKGKPLTRRPRGLHKSTPTWAISSPPEKAQ